MKRIHIVMMVVLAICLTVPEVRADVKLRGQIGPVKIDDNVVIPKNASATLNGTIIDGNVFLHRGAKLISKGARIYGNIQARGALLVVLRQQTFVGGDVQGERTRSIRILEGTQVDGNVQVKEAAAPVDVDALLMKSAYIDGDVQAEKSSGRLRVIECEMDGNLQFVENYTGPYVIRDNWIGGDLQFFKNRQGKGRIIYNMVHGNLQSKENRPRPTIKYNKVKGDLEIE